MLTGFRVLWRAIVHLWDESMLMIRSNVVWFIGSLPLYLLTVLVCGLFIPTLDAEAGPSLWPWLLSALVLLVVPSPLSAGVYAVANFVAHDESPEFSLFWQAVRRFWKRTLVMYAIGGGILGGLIFNTSFYMSVGEGLLQAVSILWLYAIIYWLTMQAYLLPLLVTAAFPPPPPIATTDDGWPLDESRPQARKPAPPPPVPEVPTLPTLYKRAAILALANPLFSLVLLFGTMFTMALSTFAMPIYPLIAMSFVALIGCRGLRALREKYFPSEARGAAG